MNYANARPLGANYFGNLLSNLVLAIEQEIETAAAREPFLCKIKNGIRTMDASGANVYRFEIDKRRDQDFSDEELLIEISGVRYAAALVCISETHLELSCADVLGQNIPHATLRARNGAILRMMKSRIENNMLNQELCRLAIQMRNGYSTQIDKKSAEKPDYSSGGTNAPNSSQRAAIENSFRNSLAIIWGPPGAGKTKTIAQAIEAHLNAGRRVLLLSNANAAVDVALAGVATQLKNSYYKQGRLVRLGIPRDERLVSEHPLTLPDKVAEAANESAEKIKLELKKEIDSVEKDIVRLSQLKKLALTVEKVAVRLYSIKAWLEDNCSARRSLEKEYAQLLEIYELVDSCSQPGGVLNEEQRQEMLILHQEMENRVASAQHLDQKTHKLLQCQDTLSECHLNLSKNMQEALNSVRIGRDEIEEFIKNKKALLKRLQDELKEKASQKPFEQSDVISSAKLVAATLAKMCYLSPADMNFDVVIVDEASMASQAFLFWAASFARKGVTLVGDFKQLPPVSSAKAEPAKTWFANSIFTQLKINEAHAASENSLVSMLDTQYRMHPSIAEICNELCYGGLLRSGESTKDLCLHDELGENHCLVLVDTSSLNPFCSPGRLDDNSGRINIMEALICRHLIKHFSKQLPLNSIGVASPYGMQAEVIAELTKDIDPDEKVLISTVHKFQGGEKDTIIFTAVDGPGKSFKSSMLNDRRDDSSAEVLLNVAISRARKKLVFIANVAYLQRQAGADSLISNVLEKFRSEGKVISASDLPFDEGLDAIDLQFSKMRKPGAAAQRIRSLRFLDERSFWPDFYNELDRCSQSLDIVTGFVGQLRSQDLLGRFKQLSKRGVRISLYTRPPAEHGTIPTQSVVTALNSLRAAGVHIYTRHETHQKCAVIDGQVAWHGSLNIMSHQGAHEQMIRIENKAEIFSMLQGLLLDRFSPWC